MATANTIPTGHATPTSSDADTDGTTRPGQAVYDLSVCRHCGAVGECIHQPSGRHWAETCHCPDEEERKLAVWNICEAIRNGLNNIADAIRELDDTVLQQGGLPHGTLKERVVSAVGDLQERLKRIAEALRTHGSDQKSNGNWNCAHPDHEDEHPSMSIIWDEDTGKISPHCHVCAPGKAEPEARKRWIEEVMKAIGLPMSVLFPNRKAPAGYEAPF